jgi:hypothetical protein
VQVYGANRASDEGRYISVALKEKDDSNRGDLLDAAYESGRKRHGPLDTSPKPEQSGRAQVFYSIPELAERWRCSRASVYNRIRGKVVLDFAEKGRRGHKVVPIEVVSDIERAHLRILR